MFSYCVREALDQGCGRMEWCALNWNVKAMDFYDSPGREEDGLDLLPHGPEGMRRSLRKCNGEVPGPSWS